ncbi:MAG: acyl-CoA carboxylase subunit beta [Anaerolineaceae bacterium]|nr:acyl-CoA carboxylase subunit beta [Anaerolineaceae bacterium]
MPEDPRILELREKRKKSRLGGGEKRIEKQHAKGKLTARERIDLLLDPGTFQELEPFVTSRKHDLELGGEKLLGDGVVTGYGQIDGRTIYVYAQDFTVSGGSLGEMQGQKISHVMDLAASNGTPVIGILDSGGARIQEGIYSLGGYAEIFRRNSQYSGVVPQISLVMGPCAGGAAYSPVLQDFIIMVEKKSFMFLTGPQVIKSVTGEETDFESLGGAATHLGISGIAHMAAPSDQDALALARRLVSYLPNNNMENPPYVEPADDPGRMDEVLNSIVPINPQTPYRMHDVVELVVDKGSFLELQSTYAQNALIGMARIGGYSVGIVGQEPSVLAGSLNIDAADKIARFVRFCDSFNVPLVTFVDSPGFLPGINQEHGGVIRHGAKILYAYANATNPKISIVTRKAYGGAYIAMSSKYMDTDVTYAWPSAEIAVMGAGGAANILYRRQIKAAEDPEAEREKLTQDYKDLFLNPYASAQAGYIDDVIEPKETRPMIVAALKTLRNKRKQNLPRKHGNMPV